MSPLEVAALLAVGLAAGTVNTIVGSGSLITFPTLLAFGYPPLTANVSNTVGLVPGTISGSIGYRRELTGQGPRALVLGCVALVGGLCGGLLLLLLPPTAFERVVPYLILVACGLVAFQGRLSDWLARHRTEAGHAPGLLVLGVFATGIYGGYFGAAQGVILIALLGILVTDDLQRLNALKNVLTAVVNGAAAVLFIIAGPVAWTPALLLAAGAVVGGQLGAVLGRRMRSEPLRGAIVVVGLLVAIRLLIA
ncbi:MAG: sulfite exporter TauE/SafE family protein [Chloroflexi bacterium]|nr:MAG: sulfite exporter TauE/SafE family protein [Chloroflexota bacterium]